MIKEIHCPHCNNLISLDEIKEFNEYSDLLKSIKDEEFQKEVNSKVEDIKKNLILENKVITEKQNTEVEILKKELEKKISDIDSEINLKVKTLTADAELNYQRADSEFKMKEANFLLQSKLAKESWEQKEKEYKDQIEYWKDLKAKQSTKMLGETLEKHCEVSFNKIRSVAYPSAYFEKDNEVVEGTKGDYIFRNFDENGIEFCSIMFEMKNEADETATKHKNEDFLSKLDKDRNKKGCKYAVLVSVLEKDNELYNEGIVDVSYKYPNMYIVRPQFFIPILSILNNSSKETLTEKREIMSLQNKQLDIVEFDKQLNLWKDDVAKSFGYAVNNRNKAVEKLIKARDTLDELIDLLGIEEKQLATTERKVLNMTSKKLAKNSPGLLLELKEDAKKVDK